MDVRSRYKQFDIIGGRDRSIFICSVSGTEMRG